MIKLFVVMKEKEYVRFNSFVFWVVSGPYYSRTLGNYKHRVDATSAIRKEDKGF